MMYGAWGWETASIFEEYFDALAKDTSSESISEEQLEAMVEDAKAGVFGPEVAEAATMTPDDIDEDEELSTSGRNWLTVNDICSFCYGDHDLEDCPELDDIESRASMTADEVNNLLDKGIPNSWGEDSPDEVPTHPHVEFEEDENKQLIPVDPNQPCYNRDTAELYTCTHTPEPLVECVECGVGREWSSHQWRPWRKDGEYNVAKRNKQQKAQKKKPYEASKAVKDEKKAQGGVTKPPFAPWKAGPTTPVKALGQGGPPPATTGTTKPAGTTTGTKTGKWAGSSFDSYGSFAGGSTYVGKDRHYDDEYTTWDGSTTFHISSMWNNRKEGEFVPDWGLYFDWGWHPWWRAEHIDWRDYGIPENFAIAFEQLLIAIEKAQAGLAVEMGCIGAHGRTGTALAVINVMLGCEAKEAIAHVREHHCEHAIESDTQEWWVEWVYAQVHGLVAPERPTYKPKYSTPAKTTTGTTTTAPKTESTACTKKEHFFSWLWMPAGKDAFCPSKGDKCGYWEEDFDEFCKGKYPKLDEASWNSINLADSIVARGSVVPKPSGMTTSKLKTADPGTGPREPRNSQHNLSAKFGCRCDTCRYVDRGHGAFLCPSDPKLKAAHLKQMNEMEERAMYNAADRKGDDVAKLIQAKETNGGTVICGTLQAMKSVIEPKKGLTPVEKMKEQQTYPKQLHPSPTSAKVVTQGDGVEMVKLATHEGTIIEVPVSGDYKTSHTAPTPYNIPPIHGKKSGEWVWIQGEGWVSEFLAKAKL